jgi:isopentenyl diphosphate isomerase/L-lactate dehydrogenase-like FMN-dependent dehydrogenase
MIIMTIFDEIDVLGAHAVFSILQHELTNTMLLCGCTKLEEITDEIVVHNSLAKL